LLADTAQVVEGRGLPALVPERGTAPGGTAPPGLANACAIVSPGLPLKGLPCPCDRCRAARCSGMNRRKTTHAFGSSGFMTKTIEEILAPSRSSAANLSLLD